MTPPLLTRNRPTRLYPHKLTVEGEDMKFTEAAGLFEKWQREKNFSKNTIDTTSATCVQFVLYLKSVGGEDDWRAFNWVNAQGYMRDLLDKGAKASTVVRRMSALSSLAQWATRVPYRRGWLIEDNPTKRFDWPRTQEPETHYLYGDEIGMLLSHQWPTYQAVALHLLLETGCRASELCNATVGDLQEIGGQRVLRVIVKGRRTRERKRSVPISDQLWAFLHESMPPAKRVDPDAHILTGRDGQRISRLALGAMITRMGKAAGITRLRLHPHVFRHSLAVRAKLAKIDPRTTSALLNHSDAGSLRRYDHIVDNELSAARDAINKALPTFMMPLSSYGPGSHPAEERNVIRDAS